MERSETFLCITEYHIVNLNTPIQDINADVLGRQRKKAICIKHFRIIPKFESVK